MIVILGASGLLGKVLYDNLNGDIVGTHNTNPYKNTIQYNSQCIRDADVVVNCIAEKNVDIAELDFKKTYEVNSKFVDEIIYNMKPDAHFIQISTDYVFDGTKGIYTIDSLPNPLQIYGITKLLGEFKARNHPKWTILRLPVLYTDEYDILASYTNLTKLMNVDSVSRRYLTSCHEVVQVVQQIIDEKMFGVYHYSSNKSTTKYYIAKSLQLPVKLLETGPGNRPEHCHLIHDFNVIEYSYDLDPFKIPQLSQDVFLILDLDGTLIDTVDMHRICYQQTTTKREKIDMIKTINTFSYIWNSDKLLDFIHEYDIPCVILTNTNRETVDHFKTVCPKLGYIKNIVTSDDVSHIKPHPCAYEEAMKFYKGQKYIMFFDDVIENLVPMEKYTKLIFHMSENQVQKRYYTLNDFSRVSS